MPWLVLVGKQPGRHSHWKWTYFSTVNFIRTVVLCLLTLSADHHELRHLFHSSIHWATGCLGLLGHFRVFLGWQKRKSAGQPNQITLQCFRRFSQRLYHLCFLILFISQGHCDFLSQPMEGERQLIIIGIKDWARCKSRFFFHNCRKFQVLISSLFIG